MKNYKELIDKMRSFILSKTTIDPKIFKKKQSMEWYLDTDTMLSNNIIDKIVDDLDEIL